VLFKANANFFKNPVPELGLAGLEIPAFAGGQTKSDVFFFSAPVIFRGIIFKVLAGLKLLAVFLDE
jgi:hypothetical protein